MTETVKIRQTTYTVEREVEKMEALTQLGWLRGPRGALAMVVKDNATGRIVAHGSSALNRYSVREVHEALAPIFQ